MNRSKGIDCRCDLICSTGDGRLVFQAHLEILDRRHRFRDLGDFSDLVDSVEATPQECKSPGILDCIISTAGCGGDSAQHGFHLREDSNDVEQSLSFDGGNLVFFSLGIEVVVSDDTLGPCHQFEVTSRGMQSGVDQGFIRDDMTADTISGDLQYHRRPQHPCHLRIIPAGLDLGGGFLPFFLAAELAMFFQPAAGSPMARFAGDPRNGFGLLCNQLRGGMTIEAETLALDALDPHPFCNRTPLLRSRHLCDGAEMRGRLPDASGVLVAFDTLIGSLDARGIVARPHSGWCDSIVSGTRQIQEPQRAQGEYSDGEDLVYDDNS